MARGNGRSKKFKAWPEGDGPTTAVAEFSAPITMEVARRAAGDALGQLRGRVQGESEDTLWLRTAASWRSFGEVVSVSFTQLDDGVQLRVQSKRWLRALVDYGKNHRNVIVVMMALRRLLQVPPAP